MTGILELLDLAARPGGTWLGSTPAGSDRPGLHGGVVAAQALRAAHLSVGSGRSAHSLHAYFLGAGRFGEDLQFEVTKIRDGRSFSVRRVDVTQLGRPLLTVHASFQVPERGHDLQLDPSAPPRPAPGDQVLGTGLETGTGGKGPFEMVEPEAASALDGAADQAATHFWVRSRQPLPEDPNLHACCLVVMGDLRTGVLPRSALEPSADVQMTSLDYSMWFRAPAMVDRWVLFHLVRGGNGGARGLTHGLAHVDGVQVASLSMELLLRERRPQN